MASLSRYQSSFQLYPRGRPPAAPPFDTIICTVRVTSPDFPTLVTRKTNVFFNPRFRPVLCASWPLGKPSVRRAVGILTCPSSVVSSTQTEPRRNWKNRTTLSSPPTPNDCTNARNISRDAQPRSSTPPQLLRVKSWSQPGLEVNSAHPQIFFRSSNEVSAVCAG